MTLVNSYQWDVGMSGQFGYVCKHNLIFPDPDIWPLTLICWNSPNIKVINWLFHTPAMRIVANQWTERVRWCRQNPRQADSGPGARQGELTTPSSLTHQSKTWKTGLDFRHRWSSWGCSTGFITPGDANQAALLPVLCLTRVWTSMEERMNQHGAVSLAWPEPSAKTQLSLWLRGRGEGRVVCGDYVWLFVCTCWGIPRDSSSRWTP